MRAVLDTNILIANLRGLRPSNDLKLVLADCRSGRFTVVVPELVIEEIVNRRREDAQEAERNLRKAQSDLAAVGATLEVPTVDVLGAVAEFRQRLVKMLTNGKVEVRGLPSVGHDRLVRRALDRRKPFNSKGAGYRDALIWETVLAMADSPDTQVVLITNNWRDFGENKEGTQIADDLVEDLQAIGAVDRVRLIPDLRAFKTEFVATETIAADELDEALNAEGSSLRGQLFDALADRLRAYVFDRYDIRDRQHDWDWEHLSSEYPIVDAELDGATVGAVERLYGVNIVAAQMFEDDMLFEFEAELDAEIEVELSVVEEGKPFSPDEPWHRERFHWNRYINLGRTLLVGGEATYRPDVEGLEDVAVHHVGF